MVRYKNTYSIIFFLVIFFFPHSIAMSDFLFSRNLRFGDRNEEVKELQKMLNRDSSTQVSLMGVGSPGNETDYFGANTLSAVMKFQNKYQSEVLAPAGLSSPTGFVGVLTRQKMNNLLTVSLPPSPPSPVSLEKPSSVSVPSSSSTSLSDKSGFFDNMIRSYQSILRLYSVSPFKAMGGTSLTFSGTGFSLANTIYFGENRKIENVPLANNSSLHASLPSDLSPGKYEVWVTNEKGSSRRAEFPVFITVTTIPISAPVITAITPSDTFGFDGEVAIVGNGFVEKNTLITGFGFIDNLVRKDPNTLSFKIADLPDVANMRKILGARPGTMMKLSFYVLNENGITESKDIFIK
jgi:hypothetical protein